MATVFVLGGFLIVIGCLFIAAGLVQVVADLLVQLRPPSVGTRELFAADAVNAAAAFVTALGKLPPFALSVVLGLVLVAFGQRACAGLLLIPW